ncbi:MAG: aldo/keto reductase [Anaerolineaceae bacterium]|nr:aldo/keto reductase [Anaerolineaceae bacterium]
MIDGKQLRRLGKTDLLVSPIGLGVMELSGGGGLLGMMFPVIPQEEKNAIIKAAVDGGINFFDTAEMYGAGVSEESLANGLKAAGIADKDVIIETKWQPIMRTANNISKTIDERLRFLGGYSISNYMIHQPMSFSSPEAEMNAMADLVEAGKIKSVGVSNFNPARMRRAHAALAKRGLPLALNQVRYSLIHREIETDGTLETARELGVTVVAYTPLGSGILSGKYHKNPVLLEQKTGLRKNWLKRDIERTRKLIAALDEIAVRHDVTVAQVALNWVIHFNEEIVVTIPGATKVWQAQESAGAMNFVLSANELEELDQISRKLIK